MNIHHTLMNSSLSCLLVCTPSGTKVLGSRSCLLGLWGCPQPHGSLSHSWLPASCGVWDWSLDAEPHGLGRSPPQACGNSVLNFL